MPLPNHVQTPRRTQDAFHPVDFFAMLFGGMAQQAAMATEAERKDFGTPPADDAVIKKLPRTLITPEHVKSEEACAVCMEEYELKMEVLELPCGHLFHEDCVVPWLSKHCSCPNCRYELKSADETYERAKTITRQQSRAGPRLMDDAKAATDASRSNSSTSVSSSASQTATTTTSTSRTSSNSTTERKNSTTERKNSTTEGKNSTTEGKSISERKTESNRRSSSVSYIPTNNNGKIRLAAIKTLLWNKGVDTFGLEDVDVLLAELSEACRVRELKQLLTDVGVNPTVVEKAELIKMIKEHLVA